jgi:hypothetical protein
MITIATASVAAILAGAAYAQAPSTELPAAKPPASSQEAPASAPTITSVKVVEINELPEASKAQVNQLIATRTTAELEKLRQAVEKAPAAKSAVEAKGFSTRDVVLAQVSNDGELTIVTRKTS